MAKPENQCPVFKTAEEEGALDLTSQKLQRIKVVHATILSSCYRFSQYNFFVFPHALISFFEKDH